MQSVIHLGSTPERGKGRPANPYATGHSLWSPGATSEWLFSAPPSYGARTVDTGQSAIRSAAGLILMVGVPVVRRWIENVLTVDHGYEPDDVTDALDNLRGTAPAFTGIVKTIIDVGFTRPVDAYSTRPVLASEKAHLVKLYTIMKSLFNVNMPSITGRKPRNAVGAAGEIFVARRLRKLRFEGVPWDANLGRETADMIVTDPRDSHTYAIEVRNRGEWLFPGSRWINDAEALRAPGIHPWLIVPRATTAASEHCRSRDIKLTILGAQIVPATMPDGTPVAPILRKLRPITGPQPFHIMRTRYDDERDSEIASQIR